MSEELEWLSEHLKSLSLSEESEGYLYGRSATQEAIEHFRFLDWEPSAQECPNAVFRERYGSRGEKLAGRLTYPIYSPAGTLLGIEARSRTEKKISEFRTPEAKWNPMIVNAPEAAKRLWAGGRVWIVEGIFDLLPLRLVLPPTDAVIATLRARLSPSHVEFLSRFCTNLVVMAYDNDETGRKATLGWTDEAGKYQFGALDRLKRANLRATDFRYRGKDPGEVWASGGIWNLKRVFLGASE